MIGICISAKLELFKKQVSSLNIFGTFYSHYQTGNVESKRPWSFWGSTLAEGGTESHVKSRFICSRNFNEKT